MTREEAIEILDILSAEYYPNALEKEALHLAIEALEQQPCEDAISKEAVIRLVEQYPNIIGNRCSGLIADIKHLPPITPSYNSIKTELKPSGDCVSREDAVNALRKALYKYEDETEKQFKESKELNLEDWFQHRIFVQNMNDIDIQTILELPPVKPQPKIDEIISRIEEARDKDQIAEYPYNRCIKIIREVLGDD